MRAPTTSRPCRGYEYPAQGRTWGVPIMARGGRESKLAQRATAWIITYDHERGSSVITFSICQDPKRQQNVSSSGARTPSLSRAQPSRRALTKLPISLSSSPWTRTHASPPAHISAVQLFFSPLVYLPRYRCLVSFFPYHPTYSASFVLGGGVFSGFPALPKRQPPKTELFPSKYARSFRKCVLGVQIR